MNKVILVGRISTNLDLKTTPNSASYVNFNIAVDEVYNCEQKTTYIDCIAWNKTAEMICKYLRTGSMIAVEGKLQKSSYINKNDQKVYTTQVLINQIQILESKNYKEKKRG